MASKLIVLLVIVLGVVAVAQLVRLYELTARFRKNGEHEISQRDNNFNARMLLLFGILYFIGFIYLMLRFGWTGRGESASVHGDELDWLLNLNFVIIIAVFFITHTLLFWFAFRYVKKPGVPALYFPHNNKLEMIWTVVPALVLAVIIFLGLRSWNAATDASSKDAIVVELFSKQFDWTARYAGEDNVLGKFDYKLTTDLNPLALMTSTTIEDAINEMENNELSGIKALEAKLNDPKIILGSKDRAALEAEFHRKEELLRRLVQMKLRHDSKWDAAAMDDVILTGPVEKLYFCKGQEYELVFRSKDVIHSMYLPHFRVQMNTVPGMTTRFKFTPDVTTKEMREKMNNPKFEYVLMCNKICGGSHYKMYMLVEVLDKPEYDKLMKDLTDGTNGQKSHKFEVLYNGVPEEAADSTAVVVDSLAM